MSLINKFRTGVKNHYHTTSRQHYQHLFEWKRISGRIMTLFRQPSYSKSPHIRFSIFGRTRHRSHAWSRLPFHSYSLERASKWPDRPSRSSDREIKLAATKSSGRWVAWISLTSKNSRRRLKWISSMFFLCTPVYIVVYDLRSPWKTTATKPLKKSLLPSVSNGLRRCT